MFTNCNSVNYKLTNKKDNISKLINYNVGSDILTSKGKKIVFRTIHANY